MITALLGYKIDAPAIDDAPPSLPAGSLLLSAPTGQKAKEALKETLGVSLEDTTLRYALVKLTRFDETLLHTTKEHGILTTAHALKPDPRQRQCLLNAICSIRYPLCFINIGWGPNCSSICIRRRAF